LLFLNIQSPWHVLVPILFTCGTDKTGKIVIYLDSLVWVSFGRFFSSYLQEISNIQNKGKKKLYRAYCPLDDKWPKLILEFYSLSVLIDYFISRPWNEEIVESSGRNSLLRAYYLVFISSLYRCTATAFYRRTATLYRCCTATNIVISKAGIHSSVLFLRSF